MNKTILAIETSCDETAVAILKNDTLLENVVVSQIATHQHFGGVIPEVASRLHVSWITRVLKQALQQAKLTFEDIDAIAITCGPGLVGALHVGLQAAKALAWYYDIDLIGVHHIAGHIYANAYVKPLRYPLLALVVSGGHTQLVYMTQENQFEVIAQTVDDAIGEAYDKVARLLDLGYPGGPIIDALAQKGKDCVPLPFIKTQQFHQFSYSGLKSAVYQLLQKAKKKNITYRIEDIACSFQERALSQIVTKTFKIVETLPVKQVLLAGGVAANSRLRALMQEKIQAFEGIDLIIPPLWCCTDNAAMIAQSGKINLKHHLISDLSLSAHSVLDIKKFHQKEDQE